MRQVVSCWLMVLGCFVLPMIGSTADRKFDESWDSAQGYSKTLPIRWGGGDSIDYTHRARYGTTPVVLTNAGQRVVWMVMGSGTTRTNNYIASTGTVQATAGTVKFFVSPESGNLTPGKYTGFVRTFTAAGAITNAVTLCYQDITVDWTPESAEYAVVTPKTNYYSSAEVDALLADFDAAVADLTNRTYRIENRTNDWNMAFGWGNHSGLYPLLATYAGATQSLWAAIANATPGGYAVVSNAAMMVFSWGNWATNNLLNQSIFAGYTNAQHSVNTNLAEQVATKADAGDVVAMLGNISNSYLMVDGERLPYDGEFNARPRYRFSTSVYEWSVHFVGEWEYTKTPEEGAIEVDTNPSTGKIPPSIGWTGGTSIQFFLGADPIQQSSITSTVAKVSNLESGVEDFEALNLGGTVIDDYSDIGLTYTNAVRLNAAITITNDSQWTGWTTTGTLDPVTHAIFLASTDQYLISPIQTNGIAYFSYSLSSHMTATSFDAVIWTNGALASSSTPWRYNNGQVYFRPLSAMVPGVTFGITISNVTITAYTDLAEAQTPKETSNLRIIENPLDATDVANKRYVDEAEAAAKAYGVSQLSAYAADKTKTLRGAELRLGNMWVVSPADTSGERFIVSGGEISGDGELIGTTNEFIIAKNDYPLMSFKSDASGLFISNFTVSATSSNLVWTLRISTNGVHSAPFAEWTENLVVGEWSRVLTCETNTYPVASDGTYTLTFCVPTNRACFVRAMQQEGSSVSKVLTDIFDVAGAAVTGVTTLTTTGGVEIVSTVQALETNAMPKTVYDTDDDGVVESARSADNAADAAYATAAGTAGYSYNSGALGGQEPSYYLNYTNMTGTMPKPRFRETCRFGNGTSAAGALMGVAYLRCIPKDGVVSVISVGYTGTNNALPQFPATGISIRVYSGWSGGGNSGATYSKDIPNSTLFTGGYIYAGVAITNTSAWFVTTNVISDFTGGAVIIGMVNGSGLILTNAGGWAVVEYDPL